ncbi:MaoC family dehydratase [Brevundimonas sp. VNH65]|uniref:MaoC family dehydratase n=1 Tax=Brevundimonas sp. VNH65 TaxID=3400917 RepID=UPI003C0F135E
MSEPLHVHFEDVEVGQVLQLGAVAVDEAGLEAFAERFAPGWDVAYGAPDAMIYALWSRLAVEKAAGWAQSKVLAVDGLRYMRNPPAGELLRGRMTVMGKDPVGDEKGIVIAQHDLLDEGGRLVFSCLTRALFSRR